MTIHCTSRMKKKRQRTKQNAKLNIANSRYSRTHTITHVLSVSVGVKCREWAFSFVCFVVVVGFIIASKCVQANTNPTDGPHIEWKTHQIEKLVNICIIVLFVILCGPRFRAVSVTRTRCHSSRLSFWLPFSSNSNPIFFSLCIVIIFFVCLLCWV